MYKIGFLSIHPGSANSLFPIIKSLREMNNPNHELHLFAFSDYAQSLWNTDNILNTETFNLEESVPTDLDILFYSAGSMFDVENSLPAFCEKHNIISVSTIDIFHISAEQVIKRFIEFPDYIIAPSEELYADLSASNKLEAKVLPFGNPHFENFLDNQSVVESLSSKKLKVSFISAPASNELEEPTSDFSIKMLDELALYCRLHHNIEKIYLCNHPRETLDYFNFFLTANSDIAHLFEINPFKDTQEACENSDVILGNTSTVLYEQLLNGKPVIFYSDAKKAEAALLNPDEIESIPNFKLPVNALDNILKYFNLN